MRGLQGPSTGAQQLQAPASARRLASRTRVVHVQARAGSVAPLTPPPREVLREIGSIGDDTYKRAQYLHNGYLETLDTSSTLIPVLARLDKYSITSRDLQLILIRYPRMFGMAVEDIDEVLAFLHKDVGLDASQIRTVITRFPHVFSYNVKGHLAPQLAYLQSLGVDREHMAEYVCARPLVLGEGIETVIKFLRVCGVQRRQMAELLRSYPIDYCCKFIFPAGMLSEKPTGRTWQPPKSEDGK